MPAGGVTILMYRQSFTKLLKTTTLHWNLHTHTHTHAHTHAHSHTHARTHTRTHAHTHTHTHTHTHAHSHTHACTHARTHTHSRAHTHAERSSIKTALWAINPSRVAGRWAQPLFLYWLTGLLIWAIIHNKVSRRRTFIFYNTPVLLQDPPRHPPNSLHTWINNSKQFGVHTF